MKNYYCWRCEVEVPMLEEHEWEEISPLLNIQLKTIKEYRAEHNVDLETAQREAIKPATDKYFELTGYKETNQTSIWHHRLSDYGPECKKCGHLFRTPKASFCANCGQTESENT